MSTCVVRSLIGWKVTPRLHKWFLRWLDTYWTGFISFINTNWYLYLFKCKFHHFYKFTILRKLLVHSLYSTVNSQHICISIYIQGYTNKFTASHIHSNIILLIGSFPSCIYWLSAQFFLIWIDSHLTILFLFSGKSFDIFCEMFTKKTRWTCCFLYFYLKMVPNHLRLR